MKRYLSIVFLFTLSSILFANNMDVLDRAVKKMDFDQNRFSYMSSIETISKDKSDIKIVSHNPNSDPVETLVKVNGNTPTKKEIKKFYKKNKPGKNEDSKTEDILGETYTLVSEDNGIAHYKYTTDTMIPKIDVNLYGELWLDLENEIITKIVISNREKLPVAIGVNLTEFYMEINFEAFDKNTSIANKMIMKIAGKAIAFVFGEESISTLYDYTQVN
ncbi:MAG: hypothetical protein OCD02_21285 [Spirochaetaceae bacterium]